MSRQDSQVFEFGPFRLIPQEHLLLNDGKPVSLTPKSFDLLRVLVENAGHLVEKRELMNLIWPNSFVEEANLSVKMSEVRRALGEAPNEQRFIETVPRLGYRFVGSVNILPENGVELVPPDMPETFPANSTSDGLSDDASSGQPGSGLSAFPVRRALAGLGVVVLLVAGAVIFDAGHVRTRLFAPAGQSPIRSMAVLPLTNLSGDPSQDYFADGMTEALITDLARVRALRVTSRTSVMQYKGAQETLPEIARKLNVDSIVEGSVQRFGDRIKITVQLIDAPADRHLWSETYERDLRDILSLQNEIAQTITQQIRVKLAPQEQKSLTTAARQVDPDAYDYYLRGKFYANRQIQKENEITIEMFERSVAADPTFAAAFAELAQAYVWRSFLFTPEEKQWEEKAYVALEKALSLDPDLGAAHLARGRYLWTPANRFQHDKAIEEYRKALNLDPSLDEARNQLALVYGHIGLLDEALEELQKALATNPSNIVAQFRIGEIYLFQGRYEQALANLRNTPPEANPALVGYQSAWALYNLGRKDEALAALDEALKNRPDDNHGLLTSVQAVLAASGGRRGRQKKKYGWRSKMERDLVIFTTPRITSRARTPQ